jgi:hypothetical protein
MRVLVACEYSGVVRNEFAKLGHDAWSCDLLSTEIPGNHYQCDIKDVTWWSYKWDLIIAHPPCTDLASSGARWFPEKIKSGSQQKSIDFFMYFVDEIDCPKICIENPIGIMSTVYRKPDQIIQPWQFGHGETKATCLWLKGLPLLQPTDVVSGREQRVHNMAPSPDRWKERSRTYLGIAKAMAEQWG